METIFSMFKIQNHRRLQNFMLQKFYNYLTLLLGGEIRSKSFGNHNLQAKHFRTYVYIMFYIFC